MLIGVGVQTLEKLGSGSSFEFDGSDESEYVVPIVFNQFGIDISLRQNLKALIFIDFAFFK